VNSHLRLCTNNNINVVIKNTKKGSNSKIVIKKKFSVTLLHRTTTYNVKYNGEMFVGSNN